MRVVLSRASHDPEKVMALASRGRAVVVWFDRWELFLVDDFARQSSRVLEVFDAGLIVFSAAAVR